MAVVKRLAEHILPKSLAPGATATPQPWPAVIQPLSFLIEARRARQRTFRWRIALICGLPTVLVFCYTMFVASSRYDSDFEITYQTYQPQTSLTSGVTQAFVGASQGNTVDLSAILYEYMRSDALLKKLDAELHLRQYYSSSKVDYLSRMDSRASSTTFQMYFHWYVSVSEGEGGYLMVTVQAFDPAYALAVSKAIIKATDEMVNKLTARAREDGVRFAKVQVAEAEGRYRKARMALTQFQNAHGDLNPQSSASQLGGIVGTIESQLMTQRAYLASVKAQGPGSPQVRAIEINIASLEQQLRDEQKRLATGNSGGAPYSVLLDQYAGLQIEQGFAQNAYQAAQQNLAVAQANAASQQNYVVDFAPPHLPDEAGIYFVLKCTLTTLVGCMVLYAVVSLLGAAMRDQTG